MHVLISKVFDVAMSTFLDKYSIIYSSTESKLAVT